MTSTNQPIEQSKKKKGISKNFLIGFGVLILLIIIENSGKDKKTDASTTLTEQPNPMLSPNSNPTIAAPTFNKEQQEEDVIKNELKAKAKRDWPDDYTQEYWVNEEIEAYNYMKTIPDGSVKRKAQQNWPLDFTTQKYWYNIQVEAQERIK